MYFAYMFYIRDLNAFWWHTFNFLFTVDLFLCFLVLMFWEQDWNVEHYRDVTHLTT